jgi:acid phosphatase
MKMSLATGLILNLFFISGFGYAKESANLSLAKQQAIHYYDSGEYDKDVKNVVNDAMRYVKIRLTRPFPKDKKPAIILDIDETSLSNYVDMKRLDFGGTLEQIRADEDKGEDPVIKPTLKLYRFAKDNHITVFFLTGRFEEERGVTENNLRKVGYNDWEKLILRDGEFRTKSAAAYKTAIRKQLSEQGYDIILNMGDQKSDLAGGYADKTFKLPNPFYLIP